MENNEFKKLIDKKIIGNIEYKLMHWVNDGWFIIYKDDQSLTSIHRVPEVFRSQNKEEAKRYFEEIK